MEEQSMKRKIIVGILVMLMISMSIGAINSNVKAFDTNPEPFSFISGPSTITQTVKGIAWNNTGTQALMVGDNYAASIEWYEQTITNHTSDLINSPTLEDVCFSSYLNKFYAVGSDSVGGAAVYEWNGGGAVTQVSPAPPTQVGSNFLRVAAGNMGIMAVGQDAAGSSIAYYFDGTWTNISGLTGYAVTAVTFYNGDFYLFTDEGGYTMLYKVYESDSIATYVETLGEVLIKDAENEILDGINHGQIGAWLATRWKLPTGLVQMIGFHHRPVLSEQLIKPISCIHLADILVRSIDFGNGGDPYVPKINKEAWESLELTYDDIDSIMVSMENELLDAEQIIADD